MTTFGTLTATSSHNPNKSFEEVELVEIVLHALQGVPSAIARLEKLSLSCSSWSNLKSGTSLWRKSGSTWALDKILRDFTYAGKIRCQLEEFICIFTDEGNFGKVDQGDQNIQNSNPVPDTKACKSNKEKRPRIRPSKSGGNPVLVKAAGDCYIDANPIGDSAAGLINQAYVTALKSILLGHTLAINTLTASIAYRRHREGLSVCHKHKKQIDGPLLSFICQEISLLELYLHSSDLRMQLEALAAICLVNVPSKVSENGSLLVPEVGEREKLVFGREIGSNQAVVAKSKHVTAANNRSKFPKGAQLLTYLYTLLLEPDPLHMELLRFLFARTWQPYASFIHSWLFCATVKDPYMEFIVEETERKVRKGVCLPSFLAEVCTELVRAGQQLQVLLQLPETQSFAQQLGVLDCIEKSTSNAQEKPVEALSDSCDDFSFFNTTSMPVLVFSKNNLEKLEYKREKRCEIMKNQFEALFKDLITARERDKDLLKKSFPKSSVETIVTDQGNKLEIAAALAALETKLGSNFEESTTIMGFYWKEMESKSHTASQQCFYFDVESDQVLGLKTIARPKPQERKDNNDIVLEASADQGLNWLEKSESGASSNLCDMSQGDLARNAESLVCMDLCKNVANSHPSSINQVHLSVNNNVDITCMNDKSAFIHVDKGASYAGRNAGKGSLQNFEEKLDSSKAESFIVDHHGGANWPKVGLPNNPFLEPEGFHTTTPHAYTGTFFIDTETAWDFISDPSDAFLSTPLGLQLSLGSSTCNTSLYKGFLRNASMQLSSPQFSLKNGAQSQKTDTDICAQTRKTLKTSGTAFVAEIWRAQLTLWFDGSPVAGSFLNGKLDDRHVPKNDKNILDESFPFLSQHSCPEDLIVSADAKYLGTCNSLTNSEYTERCSGNIRLKSVSKESGGRNFVQNSGCTELREKSGPLVTSAEINRNLEPSQFKGLLDEKSTLACQKTSCQERDFSEVDLTMLQLKDDQAEDKSSRGAFGGAMWETTLNTDLKKGWSYPEMFSEDFVGDKEIPIEVVVDRCIVQEILSQYVCISSFTVGLMQQRFNLQSHYMALRRYYFMETGDWVDYFTTAISQYKRMPSRHQHKQLELQAMLEAALQNSSCEEDTYAERLHVSIDESHFSNEAETISHSFLDHNRLGAFDFMTLNYSVEWPLCLVLTPKVLRLYNVIFSFLFRIKLSSHALRDIWRHLQVIGRSLERKKGFTESQEQNGRFRVLQLFRQQIGHFVMAVQCYLQSQLLHAVWTRFISSLENQVKDLQDLERVHCNYLEDALHECFLSAEMVGVKICINNAMQCLLDFRANLHIAHQDVHKNEPVFISDRLFSQGLRLKSSFEGILRQLYMYHTISEGQLQGPPKDFWITVDFNGFLSSTCSSGGDCA
ncbi:hypothetical protein O6H91_18G065200 [Diphasiastrum complanatum]|uniref:Uncharacterized protein n=1 Tax=Diphasiastrum complanatum TaxID=34168 RepID=A0ACC2B2A2_DIPCM|nr:hypothetical protein O6H91_18G065200 [Diphasiastrum complanatum]